MKSFFTLITRLSLQFRIVTLALMVVVSALGVVAITKLKQELLPSVSFPQTVILTQVSGMTSDQVLNAITKRLEAAVDTVDPIVNIESTTTGAFGSVIIARNNFGLNQEKIEGQIQSALDSVWLPLRKIIPADGQDPQEFSAKLLADMTPDVLIYLQEKDPNFLFQLSPDVWKSFSDDTVKTVLAYLATQNTESASNKGALRNLIDQEIVPQLSAMDVVASISVSGGQALPGDTSATVPTSDTSAAPSSLLLQLSPNAWTAVSAKAGISGPLDEKAVEALKGTTVDIPSAPPALPQSWQQDRFVDASDLMEMKSLTRTTAAVFNNFYSKGRIVGSLGQTNDLTPDDIQQILAIDPTLVQYLKAEQLAALSPEVFAALPADYITGLDGFTRDELAAKALAQTISGQEAAPTPVDLPSAWRISPPQLISFSFDDIPLATFSVSSTQATAAPADTAAVTTPATDTTTAVDTTQPEVPAKDIPEGPKLPAIFALMGGQFKAKIDTADDLINLKLPEDAAKQFGQSTLSAANLMNFIVLLADPNNLPPGVDKPAIPINPKQIIGALTPDVVAFLAKYDPTFVPNLQDSVFDYFSDDVLKLPEITPKLASAWDALANQPQFKDKPLKTAADLIATGDGKASTILNTIDTSIPEGFTGYEVRLFDSLTPATVRYLSLQEPDFYKNLSADVVKKLSPTVLAKLPDDVIAGLDKETADAVKAIAAGTQESAAQQLASQYASNVPAADPEAPTLNADWAVIGNFLGKELNTADDFSRFFPSTTNFINSFFDSAQGASFAPNMLGNLSPEAFAYMAQKDPTLLSDLRTEALQLLPPTILTTLPQDVQDRAKSGGTPFKPTTTVTRSNGNNSLLLTIYKTDGANTVEAFHRVEDTLKDIISKDPTIHVNTSFEQASFIEESISGVAREGGLGGIFAIVVILAFLSAGVWARSGRRLTGAILVAVFLGLLGVVVFSNAGATGGDLGLAFAQTDVVVKLLLILGIIIGLAVLLWPGSMPYPAWRSTLVVGVSIPLSLLMAFVLMNWLPPTVHKALLPAAESSGIVAFILRLFPASITINIMTLSGLTVAIGRVVDDSIVVLENIFRQIQEGGDKREAIIRGTRDVSVAIFSATVITVVVFLPLGMTGGIISEFFLPFGLAVTYALLSSFVVAITVVPVMAFLFISGNEISQEEHHGVFERLYLPALRWALASNLNKAIVLIVAFASLVLGVVLFAGRPTSFLPSLGKPQIAVSVNLPTGTKIIETNTKVAELEKWIQTEVPPEELGIVQTIIGSGGASLASLIGAGSGVSENIANITVGIVSPDQLNIWAQRIRTQAETIFGKGNATVSAASLSDQGFGGFELVMSGDDADLAKVNQEVLDTLNTVPGITNATSDLSAASSGASDAPPTFIRIDRKSAVSFGAELETQNTLGVTQQAIDKIKALPDLPASIKVSQGFQSDLQTQGFQSLGIAMGIALLLVVVILIITFGSFVHWFDIILSVGVAPVGAAILLTLTDRVLGISAMIGLLMLIGIVVTNAVVLIDRVQSNRYERGMSVYDALIEAGGRRLRPILMTAIATIFALMPLAIGLSKGAIIASELGTVVIGGLFSSTLLTLIVVPVMYSLLAPVHAWVTGQNKSTVKVEPEATV
ncbi:MAG: efflux RND transporter permease subunit [Chloroflexota bacterium]